MIRVPYLSPRLCKELIGGLVIWVLAALVYLAYIPGLNGDFYYDDFSNLRGLEHVEDLSSALMFVFGGEAGPLGRPLSLASFLLNVGDWPTNIMGLLRINVLIHILNGLLLVWLLLRILRLAAFRLQAPAMVIAISTYILWMALPIQASTILIPVQRMTSLSATFILAGLLFYVVGLSLIQNGHRIGFFLQGSALAICTILAILAKENGVLLPVFALVIEQTLLAPQARNNAYRRLRLAVLWLAAIAILIYLTIRIPSFLATYENRDFTLWQRLITQPVILLEYIRLAFFPRIFEFSPFYDAYPYIESLSAAPLAAIAILAWVLLIVHSIRLRNSHPIFSFAVLWFVAAHSLESTVVPLELYFQHRNYLALLGPCLAIATLGWLTSQHFRWLLPASLFSYASLIIFMLWQTTSFWGNRSLAAEIWHRENPTSVRAAHQLAQIYANDMGDVISAQRIFDEVSVTCALCTYLSWEGLRLACFHESPESIKARIDTVFNITSTTKQHPAVTAVLFDILKLVKNNRCSGLTLDDVEALNLALLENKGLNTYAGPHQAQQIIYLNLATIAKLRHDKKGSLFNLGQAWKIKPTLNLANEIVDALVSAELFYEAKRFVARARQQAPNNPIAHDIWLSRFDQFDTFLAKNEKSKESKHYSNADSEIGNKPHLQGPVRAN